MNNHKTKVFFVTQTALMLALLVGAQFLTRSFGQFITGSLVNLILLISVFLVGTLSGFIVAFASPFLAFSVGIGPAFIQIVPFIAIGNAVLVLIAQTVRNTISKGKSKEVILTLSGLLAAAIAKTAFLWIGLVVIALPIIPGMSQKQMEMIGAAFTWPQLVTAMIGGVLAMTIVPILRKALRRGEAI